MRRLLLGLTLLAVSAVASAHGWEHGGGGYRGGYGHYENHYHGGGNWIAPALIGGIIGYELSQPRTVYVQPQPQVIVQQPQVVYQNPNAPYGYHWEALLDAHCNCYRTVLVQN
jgi:hypothetical protein